MKNLLLVGISAVTLAACAPTMDGTGRTLTLNRQASAPAGITPTGSVTINMGTTTTMTTAKLSGLQPSTYYVAHYHLQGTASTDPCSSGGPPIMSTKMVGMTDAMGMLTMSSNVPSADVASATYYNVHTASDANGTPADPGVACTSIK